MTEEAKRRIQIREVIRAHLDKERALFPLGIKVLSLFFIDEVAKYRDYGRADTLRRVRARLRRGVPRAGGRAARGSWTSTRRQPGTGATSRRIPVESTHRGYFSIDKKTGAVHRRRRQTAETKRQSADADAYDLILRDKERLLSLDEPVRFIFSHSALREGWDNPNVFVMGMLKRSDNTVSRRQEIGRGLRLSVDQHGERTDNPATVHDDQRADGRDRRVLHRLCRRTAA